MYVHLFCLQVSLWNAQVTTSSHVIVTVSDSIHSSFPVEYIYILHIFRENFQKTVKKNIEFMFLWHIKTRVSAISLTWDIALINKPHVVNIFFAFLKAADEHCYDVFLPRYKVKPWVWKSNHKMHRFASENQTSITWPEARRSHEIAQRKRDSLHMCLQRDWRLLDEILIVHGPSG